MEDTEEEAEAGNDVRLRADRCRACGAVYFSRAPLACRGCGETRFEAFELRPTGTVISATQVAAPPQGFTASYDFALVRLDDGPTVFAQVSGRPTAGSRVVAIRQPIRNGSPGFGFRVFA